MGETLTGCVVTHEAYRESAAPKKDVLRTSGIFGEV